MGHRIAKHVLTSANVLEKSTYYILDAQGNTMAVYERAVNASNQSVTFDHTEKHLYGSSRLGVMNIKVPMLGSQNTSYSMINKKHRIGERNYELSNHLGNVLSVISDKPVPHTTNGTTHDYYMADIMQSSDYSPFGVTLSGRNFVKANAKESRRGFNGMEEDDEIKGDGNSYDFGARMLDSRLGRFLSRDPKETEYPWQSTYCYASNNPVLFIDNNGEGPILGWMCKFNRYNKETNTAELGYKINVSRTIYVVNSSTMNLNNEAKAAICNNISAGYREASFSYDLTSNEIKSVDCFMDKQLPKSIPDNAKLLINVEIQFYANVKFVNSIDEITDENATIMEMVDDIPIQKPSGIDPVGLASPGGDGVKVEAPYISPKNVNVNGCSLVSSKVSIHELLHLDGATDLYQFKNGTKIKDSNSMMGTANTGRTLANETKSEIALYYFQITRMANDLEAGTKYKAQEAAGIVDIPGKYSVQINNPDSTNKKDIKKL